MKHHVFRLGLKALGATGVAQLAAPWTAGLGAILMCHHVRPFQPKDFTPNRILEITPEFLDAVLSHAKARMHVAIAEARQAKPSSEAISECTNLWRCAAAAGAEMVQAFDYKTKFAVGEISVENVNKLVDLLEGVRDGASPCFNNGTPRFPSWAQRRRFRRIVLNMEAMLVTNGREHKLLVADVSQGGMRIVTAQPLKIGAIVIVRLGTGRRFVSVVSWQNGQSVGVRFNRELPPDDPLLASG